MKKVVGAVLTAVMVFAVLSQSSFAAENNKIRVHGLETVEIDNSVLVNGSAMVPVRVLSDALGFELIWLGNLQTVVMWNDTVEFRAQLNSVSAQINAQPVELVEAPVLIDSCTYLPLRNVAEAACAKVVWNADSNNIDVYLDKPENTNNGTSNENMETGEKAGLIEGKPFYSQRQSEWGFENNGSGYCWVCAYAMAITAATDKVVTPKMVAEVNARSGSGAYMQHGNIMAEFGLSFCSAVNTSSQYFDRYDGWRGATYIKAENDEEAIAALKEALDLNPQGVMVRYTVYPHTLLAVSYSGDTIYFHEPAYQDGEAVTFDRTCLKKYKISDFDFLQAIERQSE